LPAKCAGQVTFTAACGPGDQDVFRALDECTIGQCHELLVGEVAGSIAVNLFQKGIVPEFALGKVEFGFLLGAVLLFRLGKPGDEHIPGELFMDRKGQGCLISPGHSVQSELLELIYSCL
jgi:hypothetical protein